MAYKFDGKYIMDGSRRLFEFDGKYIKKYCSSRLFEFDGRYIKKYCGSRLYELTRRDIKKYCGGRLAKYDDLGDAFITILTLEGLLYMPIKAYSKLEFLGSLKKEIATISNFYASKLLNYRGITSDTKEKFEDVAVDYILQNLALFDDIATITRETSYKTSGHGQFEPNTKSNRKEEWLAKGLYGQELEYLGKVIDYQVPLKNKLEDGAGKIDLISFAKEKETLYLIELKNPDSKETLLRCLMEVHTYSKQINQTKLLNDFGLSDKCQVVPTVLIFEQSYAAKHLDNPLLQKLKETLGISLFVANDKMEITLA